MWSIVYAAQLPSPRRRREDTTVQEDVLESGSPKMSSVSNIPSRTATIATGFFAALLAAFRMPTLETKLIGAIVCVVLTGLLLQAEVERGRKHLSNSMLAWVTANGLALVGVLVLLLGRPDASPTTSPPGEKSVQDPSTGSSAAHASQTAAATKTVEFVLPKGGAVDFDRYGTPHLTSPDDPGADLISSTEQRSIMSGRSTKGGSSVGSVASWPNPVTCTLAGRIFRPFSTPPADIIDTQWCLLTSDHMRVSLIFSSSMNDSPEEAIKFKATIYK
jgi:hypothetical protein